MPGWARVTGTADGFGLVGLPFEALVSDEQRITLWSVSGETWMTAALRPGWDATRQLGAAVDIPALVSALTTGDVTRTPLAPPKPGLFAGLLSRNAPDPVEGARFEAAGVVFDEWPVSRKGGIFTNVVDA